MKRRFTHIGGVNVLFQLTVLALAIGVLSILGLRAFGRMGSGTPVVVARATLPAGGHLEKKQLRIVRVAPEQVPPGALKRVAAAAGRKLYRAKRPGEPVTSADLQPQPQGSQEPLSSRIPEGRVLTTLTLGNLTVPHNQLMRGDRVDILVSGMGANRMRAARIVAADAFILGYVTPRRPLQTKQQNLLGMDLDLSREQEAQSQTALLLALEPEDVLPVAEIDGSGMHISLVLHNRETVKRGEMIPLAPEGSPTRIDVIHGSKREQVIVQ